MPKPPSALAFAPAQVEIDRHSDGSLVLRSAHALGPYPRHLCDRLRHWANEAPDRVFVAERNANGEGFRTVTYAQAKGKVDRIATALIDRGLGPERPLMILSENSVDHALMTLGAMQAGAAASPISTAYSLVSKDFNKLRAIAEILDPGLVYAEDADRYASALGALRVPPERVVTRSGRFEGSTSLDELCALQPSAAMEQRYASLGEDSIAKVLFTSGSTGEPKGVINTQRMLCSNQQAIATLWPFLYDRPPVVLDWLPWSHTFGANHNFNMVLFHGGSLYIDDGKPTPELSERTARNLREISPTLYFNVPRGYDALLPLLERDEALRASFFRELDVLFYAAASLPNPLWERLEAVSVRARGERVAMLSAWGSTETSPMATSVHFHIERAGVIGLPAPGTAIKLAPVFGKYELRVKGPNVTPGYWKRPDLSASAFDEEGFFRMGDAGRLRDDAAPEKGLIFDGRIAEDFKLASGTWVHVGALRTAVVAAMSPLAQDAVVTGLDRDAIGLLVFLNTAACQAICPDARPDELAGRSELRERLAQAIAAYNAEHPSNSHRVGRLMIASEPPSIDAGEITDKGYINQRAVLARRAQLVDRLYQGGDEIIVLSR